MQKKEGGQYPVILTEQAWSIYDILYYMAKEFLQPLLLKIPSRQDGSILTARITNQNTESLQLAHSLSLPYNKQ